MRSDFFITSLDFFQGRASTIVQEAFPFRSLQISLTPKSLKPPERLLCSRFAENSSKTIMRSSRLRTQLSLSCFVKGLGPIHTFSQPTVSLLKISVCSPVTTGEAVTSYTVRSGIHIQLCLNSCLQIHVSLTQTVLRTTAYVS